jgi:GMP synthase-like glutamine amidotransferase
LFTAEGLKDPLTKKLARNPEARDSVQKIKVFHWHGETFDIPKGAVKLASSALFPNQAFRYGERAYAFQFHIEVRKEMIYEWLKDEKMDLEKVKKDTERFYDDYRARAHQFYEAFFGTK